MSGPLKGEGMPEEGKEDESAQKIEQALASLRERRKEERVEKVPPNEVILNALAELPSEARERLQRDLDDLKIDLIEGGTKRKAIDKILASTAVRLAKLMRETYVDSRFHVGPRGETMLNHKYGKETVTDAIDEILANDPKIVDFKKVARLSFDVNGLKAVNDFTASHERGTKFLERIANVFADGRTRSWLRSEGIKKVSATTAGGDEFTVMLFAKDEISEELIQEAIERFEAEIRVLNVSDLINFSDPEVLQRSELTKKEIPSDFRFRATASGGGATLLEGLTYALSKGNRRLNPNDKSKRAYERALGKIMGGLWDASDEKAAARKNDFKQGLQESSDPADLLYAKLLLRTPEARELVSINQNLDARLRVFEEGNKEITKILDANDQGILKDSQALKVIKKNVIKKKRVA